MVRSALIGECSTDAGDDVRNDYAPGADAGPPTHAVRKRGRGGRKPVIVADGPAPEIDRLLELGWPFAAIAATVGVHEQTIKGWRIGRLKIPSGRRTQLAGLLLTPGVAA